VELIGGRIYKHSNVSVGSVAIEAIRQIRADLYFMGVTGINAEHGLTTGDREEAAVKRAICRQAAETVVLGSREKLGAVSAYSVVSFDDVDGLIVSRKCPEGLLTPLRVLGMQITNTTS
jgi:DeoR/GlpR family transcriptional regulator of sugar metabolism